MQLDSNCSNCDSNCSNCATVLPGSLPNTTQHRSGSKYKNGKYLSNYKHARSLTSFMRLQKRVGEKIHIVSDYLITIIRYTIDFACVPSEIYQPNHIPFATQQRSMKLWNWNKKGTIGEAQSLLPWQNQLNLLPISNQKSKFWVHYLLSSQRYFYGKLRPKRSLLYHSSGSMA